MRGSCIMLAVFPTQSTCIAPTNTKLYSTFIEAAPVMLACIINEVDLLLA
jgi:hypothetical protein